MLDGTFLSADEDANVRLAELKFRREIRSLEEVWLVDSKGTKLQKFLIATDDVEKRTWKIPADSGTGFVLKKGVPTVLGVVAKLKSRDTGGASQELIEIERFAVGVTGATSLQSREIVPTDQHYPLHQTAQAILTKVTNNLQNAGSLPAGTKKLIGGFTFSGRILPGVQLRLSEVTLRAQKKGVTLSRIRIGGATEVQQTECGVESADPGLIECVALPESLQEVIAGSGRTLQVYADVALTGADPSPTLQLTLEKAGSLGVEGSVKWTDGSGRFNWIEGTSPLARSTLWSVTQ